jgi:hypothetical protein
VLTIWRPERIPVCEACAPLFREDASHESVSRDFQPEIFHHRLPKKRAASELDEKDRNPRFRRPMNNGSIYMPKCYE